MNWLLLILAGCFETAFAFCLGKMRETDGTAAALWRRLLRERFSSRRSNIWE